MKISIATSIRYGNYQHLYEKSLLLKHTMIKLEPVFRAHFDFREGINVVIRPIRGSIHGRALDSSNAIEIDPRYAIERIIETAAHEFVHSEQYKQGRLKNVKHTLYNREWNGVLFKDTTTHKQYLQLPWEIEARERAAVFVNTIYPQHIGK